MSCASQNRYIYMQIALLASATAPSFTSVSGRMWAHPCRRSDEKLLEHVLNLIGNTKKLNNVCAVSLPRPLYKRS